MVVPGQWLTGLAFLCGLLFAGHRRDHADAMRTEGVQDLFNGLNAIAIQLQSRHSAHFFACHMKPGTRLQSGRPPARTPAASRPPLR